MEINIIELYNMFARNPENFEEVLKNLYGRELYRLLILTREANALITDEDGKRTSRNNIIESELDDLAQEFEKTILLMSFFRYVTVSRKNATIVTSSSLIKQLTVAKSWITACRESIEFKYLDKSYNSQDMKVFAEQVEKIMVELLRVDTLLMTLDESLKDIWQI